MDQWLSWLWVAMAVIFAVAEIFTAGFFLICFGIGAAAAAAMAFLGFAPVIQLAVFVGVSVVAVYVARPFADRVSGPNTHQVGIDRVIGQQAMVLETIDPARGRGLVRVGQERWSAQAADGAPIAAGTVVEVVSVEGAHLKVRTAPAQG
jgi:membrane protein implicated in regulation of membrane protease activity